MDERRKLPRWEIKKQAKVWIPLNPAFSSCMIEDMHLKGMCVSFEKPLPHEKTLRMSFTMGEDYDFIKVEALIPWMKQKQERYVYGLAFSQINDEDKEKLYKYINTHCYDQFKSKWWAV